jgi:deoxyribose-phosphate aldolase
MFANEQNLGIPFDARLLHTHRIDLADVDIRAERIRRMPAPTGSAAIDLLRHAITFLDLTTLSDSDTDASVSDLCDTALHPVSGPLRAELGLTDALHTAAICVFGRFAGVAAQRLHGTGVRVAAVAGGFPVPLATDTDRLDDIRNARAAGAEEIDAVVTKSLALEGRWDALYDEVAALREAAGDAPLKTILATGDLSDPPIIWNASMTCMMAGADFIKTSTGREEINATLTAGIVMADAIHTYFTHSGSRVGIKPSGGLRRSDQALGWIRLVEQELDRQWLTPARFRIGASTVLNDIVRELEVCAAAL